MVSDSCNVDSSLLQPALDGASGFSVLAVEPKVSAVASDVSDEACVAANIAQFYLKETTCVMDKFEKVIVLNFLPDCAKVNNIHHINVLIELCSVVKGTVEATEASVTSECHEISATTISLIEVPILVRPHLG